MGGTPSELPDADAESSEELPLVEITPDLEAPGVEHDPNLIQTLMDLDQLQLLTRKNELLADKSYDEMTEEQLTELSAILLVMRRRAIPPKEKRPAAPKRNATLDELE